MKKTREYVQEYRGNGPEIVGLCGVRIYEAEGRAPVVVCSEPPAEWGYSGPWISHAAEHLAAEILRDALGGKAPFHFIEHVPRGEAENRAGLRENYDLVTFEDYSIRPDGFAGHWRERIGEADFAHLGIEEAGRSRAEALYGAPAADPGYLGRFRAGVAELLPPPEAPPTEEGSSPDSKRKAGSMLPPLPWDPESGDVVLARVPNFAAGLDTGSNLMHEVQTNVPWSVVEHSPDGFEWGYGGSGPADLALNILNLFEPPGTDGQQPERCFDGECSRTAQVLHQAFKRDFIAPMPWTGGTIPGVEIRSWISGRVVRVGGKVVGYVGEGAAV